MVAREFKVETIAYFENQKKARSQGRFLCTDQYCTRYMVGTRGKGEVNTGTNHLGFRCVQAP